MNIKVIITGVTGMVGEEVLHEALLHPDVETVLVLTRKPTGIKHPKLREIVHSNFYDLSAIESPLTGYNACFFCLGVTSIGKKEDEYRHLTYDLTVSVATTLCKLNPDMTFCYISGAGTDSSEKGKVMWARVKGKTENALKALPFKAVYLFRPGYLHPTPGMSHTNKYIKYILWLYPLLRRVYPSGVSTMKELALGMINVAENGYPTPVLEVRDFIAASR